MISPFSILDTRTGEWKQRKEYLINQFNIQSELGREDLSSNSGFWETGDYTSVFDPVLTENIVKWFTPPSGKILDPFAGGSVRGIIATEFGYDYTGIDLSEQQILANRKQSDKPNWIIGDSMIEIPKLDNDFDFVFTCPPYHDLEVYSDNENDISNMDYGDFKTSLNTIIRQSVLKLKDNRFFGIVVSEIRELSKTGDYKIGKYKGFVPDVIKMCESNGLSFYNDMILFNSQHQASRTGKVYFERNRKIPSVHQNVLIFVKGNPDLATEVIDFDGVYDCTIDGVDYRSFREAAITLDPNKLVASEIIRRCDSRKSKYQNFQRFGQMTKPKIKYVVDGIPFEHPKQIAKKLGNLHESTIRECTNRINSNNPKFRHWNRVDDYKPISYERLFILQKFMMLRVELPTIECDGIPYSDMETAGISLGVSTERIRQKLKDEKFPTFKYLY